MDDDYVREAVQKTIASDIEKRVYGKIKGDITKLKFAGVVGALLLAIIASFHEQIFRFIIDHGGQEFRDGIKSDIANEEASHRRMLSDIDAARDLFRTQLAQISNDFFRRSQDISQLEAQLGEERTQTSELLKTLRDERDAITTRTAAAQSVANEAAARLDENIGHLNTLAQNQDMIVAQLKNLKADTSHIQSITTSIAPALNDNRKPTVYFQFAGFTRAEAEAISRRIKEKGWTIPGEERNTLASQRADTNQIRYNPSNPIDLQNAQKLKADTTDTLHDLNLQINLQLQSNSKVVPGIIEIWILKP